MGKLIKLKLSDHTTTPTMSGDYKIYINQWWYVTSDECILKTDSNSFQTNSVKRILDFYKDNEYYKDCTIRKIPIVYVRK